MSSVPVSNFIDIDISVAAIGPTTPTFSLAMIVGSSSRLPTYERARLYADMTEVAADFSSTDEEYKAAAIYFGQSPTPDEIMIGRRFTAATAGTLYGANSDTTLATFTAVANGGFDITIDGSNLQIYGVNLSGAATISAVATLVQTALAAADAGVTCTYTGGQFLITSSTTGATSIVDFAQPPTGGSSPTDIGTMLGITSAAGARKTVGLAIESITDSLNALKSFSDAWYGFTLTNETTAQNRKDAMAFAEANAKLYFCTTQESTAIDGSSSADLGSYAKTASYSRTYVQYSSGTGNIYAAVSAMARALVVDYSQPNSTLTLMFKQLPGITPEDLSSTQRAALAAKNIGVYVTVSNGFIMLIDGKVANGRFLDEVMNLDWLKADAENNVFTALATTATKIPQTDAGVLKLVDAIATTMRQAVSNGCLAPGVWTGSNFGELKSGDTLGTGWYIYAAPVSSQSAASRATRVSPPITVACIGAGALHGAAITINFQR